MSDRSPDINPYAPPKADLQGPAAVGGLSGPAIPPTSAQMAEALARLKQHVASAQSLAEDARAPSPGADAIVRDTLAQVKQAA